MTRITLNTIIALPLLSALTFAAPAVAAQDTGVIEIQNFVGRITLKTGPDFKFDVTEQALAKTVSFEQSPRRLLVDGNIKRPRSRDCKRTFGRLSWNTDKSDKTKTFGGYKNLEDYPNLIVTAPDSATLRLSNSIIFGTVGSVGKIDIEDKHCSRFEIGNVSGLASVDLGGKSVLEIGNAGRLDADIGGASEFTAGNTAAANISAGGAANADIGDVSGFSDVSAGGASSVEIEAISGGAKASASGAADINIDSINGPLDLSASGSSDIDINDGRAATLIARASGSSDISFGGTASSADLKASGSADIRVTDVTGEVIRKTSGSADIDVN